MVIVGTTIEEQTRQVFANISTVLNGMGLGFENIVKTTVFLKSMDDFKGMNGVYAEMFDGHKPEPSGCSCRDRVHC